MAPHEEVRRVTFPEGQAQGRLRTMQALVLDPGPRLATIRRPQPLGDGVLVKVRLCAIARSDLDLARGLRPTLHHPMTLGHEFVGEAVEASSEAGRKWLGKHVVAQLNPPCNRCLACRDGKSWLCATGRQRALGMGSVDGALAEWVVVPEPSLVEVPEGVDDEEAVFAHPLASALQATDWVDGPPPQRVLVIGDGNLGLLTTLVFHAAGHTVSVLGRHPSRRELLWRSGISYSSVARAGEGNATLSGAEITSESYGLVIDCSGHSSGFDLAVTAVRPRGRIILMSRYALDEGFDLRFLTEREIDLVGVNGGRLERSLEYLKRKRIDILPLVEANLPLLEAEAALERADTRGTLKVIVRPSTGGGAL